MLDLLRAHIAAFLTSHHMCVVMAPSRDGVAALPVRYRANDLEIDCLLPRWADVTFCLEQHPAVALVIPPTSPGAGGWLQIVGTARRLDAPDWAALLPARPTSVAPQDLYHVVRVQPQRFDLLDEERGWGARETLELV